MEIVKRIEIKEENNEKFMTLRFMQSEAEFSDYYILSYRSTAPQNPLLLKTEIEMLFVGC